MISKNLEPDLKEILAQYRGAFSDKRYKAENDEHDPLMDVFGLTPNVKRENRQYWGRELGMCWQRLVCQLFSRTHDDYKPALNIGADEPCDCIVGSDAIDTKYRFGSGDSGTKKKLKQYGKQLSELGYRPVLLIVRQDNLPAAITACQVGGWTVYQGATTFQYIQEKSGYDLLDWLNRMAQTQEFFIQQ